MSTDLEFPVEKQRTWEKIARLIDKELEADSKDYREQIKALMASTLQENEALFTDDLPYLLALIKEGESESLQNYPDTDSVKKVQEFIDLLTPKIKTILHTE